MTRTNFNLPENKRMQGKLSQPLFFLSEMRYLLTHFECYACTLNNYTQHRGIIVEIGGRQSRSTYYNFRIIGIMQNVRISLVFLFFASTMCNFQLHALIRNLFSAISCQIMPLKKKWVENQE